MATVILPLLRPFRDDNASHCLPIAAAATHLNQPGRLARAPVLGLPSS